MPTAMRRAHEHVEVGQGALGQLGGRRLHPRQGERALLRPGKLHDIDHRGEHFRVKGPLNVPRSPQGHPVIVQAGPVRGRPRARRRDSAEVIFTAHQNLDTAQEFYRDIKARVRAASAATPPMS